MKKTYSVILSILFLLLVSYFLGRQLSEVRWSDVLRGLSSVRGPTLIGACLLVVLNYFILGSYDYMGIRTLGMSALSYRKILLSAFICYAFTLNLGALIGGLGFRYKIYPQWGVEKRFVPKIILLSILANWSGYLFLTGLALLLYPREAGEVLRLNGIVCVLLGIFSISFIIFYLFFCYQRKTVLLRETRFQFPRFRTGLIQLLFSLTQWLSLTSIIYLFLGEVGEGLPFTHVLFTFLLTCLAGVITHVPAGLGILESLFIRLNPSLPPVNILVALLCYRALYYLIPLLLAVPSYICLEIYFRHRKGFLTLSQGPE